MNVSLGIKSIEWRTISNTVDWRRQQWQISQQEQIKHTSAIWDENTHRNRRSPWQIHFNRCNRIFRYQPLFTVRFFFSLVVWHSFRLPFYLSSFRMRFPFLSTNIVFLLNNNSSISIFGEEAKNKIRTEQRKKRTRQNHNAARTHIIHVVWQCVWVCTSFVWIQTWKLQHSLKLWAVRSLSYAVNINWHLYTPVFIGASQ